MRRVTSFFLATLLLITPALAMATTWEEILSSLSDEDLLILLEMIQDEIRFRGLDPSAKLEQMVWVPRSGEKYHKTSTCSNMKNPRKVPLSDAIRFGYEPCKRCKP